MHFDQEFKYEDWVEIHIRHRLIAVDGLAWVCETLLRDQPRPKVGFSLNGIDVDAINVINALCDAGLANGRALCEFLGLRVGRASEQLERVIRSVKRKGVDLWPEDLGVHTVPFARACSFGPGDPNTVRAAIGHFLRVANGGVAHLTFGSPVAEIEKIYQGTEAIRELCMVTFRESNALTDRLEKAEHEFRTIEWFAGKVRLAKAIESAARPT
jgi:hypothetical protein